MIKKFTVLSLLLCSSTVVASENVVSDKMVCKATIAGLMHQKPYLITVEEMTEDYLLYYTREIDKTEWTYKCKVEGNNVIWGTASVKYSKLRSAKNTTFTVSDDKNKIIIIDKYVDGSETKKIIDIKDL
ncbi:MULTISPECIES: hypothetical protein [Yersinia pseudotuberculosis complex]|uniref:hypothetical protein n=1 Tax=Yersinia pseudotuberculosis complex TaxID=1649845 RepID=UPI00059B4094|nr:MULTISPECIES: hypothetical protein [Yersinia pseudotuberculosis complex]MCE4113253.1 hypothetical protein [Yersinia pseudotuberculosis]RYC26264.1 hypothetical protein EU971_11345 [Yersinia pseudotuberculosis]UFA64094.1 Uncharacterized protein YP598_4486 [Yersinia pseudotuberculosis]WLF06136.1 hypothetical protein Q6G25_21180 [Yersinia pseudotuberculosis]